MAEEWRRMAENGGERRKTAKTWRTAENGGEWRRMAGPWRGSGFVVIRVTNAAPPRFLSIVFWPRHSPPFSAVLRRFRGFPPFSAILRLSPPFSAILRYSPPFSAPFSAILRRSPPFSAILRLGHSPPFSAILRRSLVRTTHRNPSSPATGLVLSLTVHFR